MDTPNGRYYRIALFANPSYGHASFSWQLKESFEARGHCVFWFTPEMWDELFDGGVADASLLLKFFARWDIDIVMVSDGLGLKADDMAVSNRRAVVVAQDSEQLTESIMVSRVRFSCALCCDAACANEARNHGMGVFVFSHVVSRTTHDAILANKLICDGGVVCFQPRTPSREGQLMRLVDEGFVVRCLDSSWNGGLLAFNCKGPRALYALKGSDAVVEFGECSCDREQIDALNESHGWVKAIAADMGIRLISASDDEGLCRNRWPAARLGASDVCLDDELPQALEAIHGRSPRNVGCSQPSRMVCVLGYVGRGNFGDEFILDTIASRIALRCPGVVTIAFGEDRWHTLLHHGIYALDLGQTYALEESLRCSSAALVMAGLLFDQGIRWTMGKAQLLAPAEHTDIPGIAAYTELAFMNDVPVVFYGIGAGPLALGDSKSLMNLVGKTGALFLARDCKTADLLKECDIPDAQIKQRADVAFTSQRIDSSPFCDQWLTSRGLDSPSCKLVVVSLRFYESVTGDFAARIACALDRLLRHNASVHVVLCVLDPDDACILREVLVNMELSECCSLFDAGGSTGDMAAMFARAYLGLSMRYHCSLLLNKNGVPCVGLGYLPKVVALYEEVGSSADLLLDMDASVEAISGALIKAFDCRDELSSRIARGVAHLVSLAHCGEDELVEVVCSSKSVRERVACPRELYFEDEIPLTRRERESERRLFEYREALRRRDDEICVLRARVDELERGFVRRFVSKAVAMVKGLL